MSIHEKLSAIQSELKAPKSQRNTFGNYNYRSCEDILEAVKPLLKKHGLVLTISDDIVEVGSRIYVKATAKLEDGQWRSSDHNQLWSIESSAFAREQEAKLNKEGRETMDHAQLTGAASSYARKYALNGLFCIDDTKDADTRDNTQEQPAAKPAPKDKCSSGDVVRISNLAKETKSDLVKVYQHFGVQGAPTKDQAAKIIAALEKKLSAQVDSAA